MRACLFAMALMLAWLPWRTVRAELPFPISWKAPSACPDEPAARRMIEQAVGNGLVSEVRSVRAEITANGPELELELWLVGAHDVQHRRGQAQRCDTFVQLIALELRLTAAPAVTAAQSPDEARPAQRLQRYGLRLSGTLASGPVPAPAPGVALGFTFAQRSLLLSLGASYWTPRTQSSQEDPGVAVRLDGFGADARGCYAPSLGRLRFPICGGIELGVLRGRASGVDEPQHAQSLWVALFAGPSLQVRLGGPVWATAGVAGFVGLRRPRFGVRNLPELVRPPLFSVRGGIGLALEF